MKQSAKLLIYYPLIQRWRIAMFSLAYTQVFKITMQYKLDVCFGILTNFYNCLLLKILFQNIENTFGKKYDKGCSIWNGEGYVCLNPILV